MDDAKTILLDENGKPVTGSADEFDDRAIIQMSGERPANVIVVPLDEHVLFPGMTLPMVLTRTKSQEAVDYALSQGPFIALVPRKKPLDLSEEETADQPMATPDELVRSGVLARVLKTAGGAEQALPLLDEAQRRFEAIGRERSSRGAERMASACLTERGDCLLYLGRLDDAAGAYEEAIARDEGRGAERDVAVGKGQLGTVRLQQGRLDAETGYGWQLTPARRALDTRECTEAWCDDRPAAGELIELDLGTTAPGAAVAITVTDTEDPGYVWVGPCSDMEGLDEPTTSNVNHMAGQTVTGLALIETEAGAMCIYTRASAHVIIDVQAELVDVQRAILHTVIREHAPQSPVQAPHVEFLELRSQAAAQLVQQAERSRRGGAGGRVAAGSEVCLELGAQLGQRFT